jgi:hypothetical protein
VVAALKTTACGARHAQPLGGRPDVLGPRRTTTGAWLRRERDMEQTAGAGFAHALDRRCPVTWRDTEVWLVLGMPVVCLLLVAVDRSGAPSERRSFRPAVRPRATRHHHLRGRRTTTTTTATPAATAAGEAAAAVGAAAAPVVATGPDADGPRRLPTQFVPVIEARLRPPRPVRHPWVPGDNLHRPLATGAPPGPATVRKRAWNAYARIAPVTVLGARNVERLERGRAPMRYNPLLGGVELMEVDVSATGHAHPAWPDSATPLDPFAATS